MKLDTHVHTWHSGNSTIRPLQSSDARVVQHARTRLRGGQGSRHGSRDHHRPRRDQRRARPRRPARRRRRLRSHRRLPRRRRAGAPERLRPRTRHPSRNPAAPPRRAGAAAVSVERGPVRVPQPRRQRRQRPADGDPRGGAAAVGGWARSPQRLAPGVAEPHRGMPGRGRRQGGARRQRLAHRARHRPHLDRGAGGDDGGAVLCRPPRRARRRRRPARPSVDDVVGHRPLRHQPLPGAGP